MQVQTICNPVVSILSWHGLLHIVQVPHQVSRLGEVSILSRRSPAATQSTCLVCASILFQPSAALIIDWVDANESTMAILALDIDLREGEASPWSGIGCVKGGFRHLSGPARLRCEQMFEMSPR
jgi:hypothetical protein